MRLFPFTAIIAITAAQQDPILDFCRRHQHQTCVIDSKLYIDGGKVHYGVSVENNSISQQNTYLLYENVLATDNVTSFPKQYKNLTKTSEVPSVSGGVLWPDTTNKLFYLFGGEYDDVKDVQTFNNLWYFDVLYNSWNRSTPSETQVGVSWPAFGSGTVTEGGIAYYYGGWLSNKTTPKWSGDPVMLSSLTSFDMNTQTWANRTYDETRRAEGTMQYIPASSKGMLVYFGGLETDLNGAVQHANMSVIRLFDVAESKWFTQISTGDVPTPRRGMCAGVIWPDDRSSFNLYVQGGIGPEGKAFGETYILSLPSFQWSLLYPEPSLLPNTAHGKAWSSCNVVRNSQMVIMGGQFANTSYTPCDDPEQRGQHGLLLGQENAEVNPPKIQWWWRLMPEFNSYRVPDKIVSLVGGSIDGHATKTAPLQGWTTPSLSAYFHNGINYVPPRTATRAVPDATGQPTGQPAPSGPNVGAIAGGTVGGVMALAALITVVLLCLRRRRKGKTVPTSSPELDNTTKSELDGLSQKMSLTPAHSPHSPSNTNTSWSGEQHYYHPSPPQQWVQQGIHTYSQPYYSPPDGFSPSELPDVRSPARTNAELSDVRSPTGGGSLAPVRELL